MTVRSRGGGVNRRAALRDLSLGALPPPTKKYWTGAARPGMCPGVARSDRSQAVRVPLRVLIAEDSEDDARLLLRELQRAGFDPAYERVDSRSEEHTSELQSLAYLVCRLLLEKKKNRTFRKGT